MSEEKHEFVRWLESLSDEDLMKAFASVGEEYNRRWPGSCQKSDPADSADEIARKIAQSQAALPETLRGRTQ